MASAALLNGAASKWVAKSGQSAVKDAIADAKKEQQQVVLEKKPELDWEGPIWHVSIVWN